MSGEMDFFAFFQIFYVKIFNIHVTYRMSKQGMVFFNAEYILITKG